MQKIQSIHAYAYGNGMGTDFLFVRLESDGRIIGAGEATLHGQNHKVTDLIEQVIAPKLIGRELSCTNYMQKEFLTKENFKKDTLRHAVSGVEMAAWDAIGKEKGLPVYKLLGGRILPQLSLIPHYQDEAEDKKIAYTSAYAPWEKTIILSEGRTEEWEKICKENHVPLAARLSSRFDVFPLLEKAPFSFLEADILQSGGIASLKQLAAYAETYYIKISSRVSGGAIAAAAAAQVLCTCPNTCGVGMPETDYAEILTNSFQFSDDAPGIGIEVKWNQIM